MVDVAVLVSVVEVMVSMNVETLLKSSAVAYFKCFAGKEKLIDLALVYER